MRTILIYLMGTFFLLNFCKGNTRYSEKEILAIKQPQENFLKKIHPNDTLLLDIQQKVLNAFIQSKISQTDKALTSLEQALFDFNKANNNDLIIYWYSYACYYHSILFMTDQKNENSEKILEEGIEQLNNINLKNSEHLALLALMESLSIQFASIVEIPFISKRVKQNASKALQLDSLNLRAYYVLGSNDFYTPEQYGGGKKVEGYLKKAISLKNQSISNQYSPSWGKNSAYEMLIRFYINHKQFDEAKKYYSEAIHLFPKDYMINKLSGELINY